MDEILRQARIKRLDETIDKLKSVDKELDDLQESGVQFNTEEFLKYWNKTCENYPLLLDMFVEK